MRFVASSVHGFLWNTSSAVGMLLAACLMLGASPSARSAVLPWDMCTAPNVTPGSECTGFIASEWEYTAPAIGSSDSLPGVIGVIQSAFLSNTNICSFDHTATALDQPNGPWGAAPVRYHAGIVSHRYHKLTFQQTSGTPYNPCHSSFPRDVWVAQSRIIKCPAGFSAISDSAPGFVSYCARRWTAVDPTKCPPCAPDGNGSAMMPGNPIDVSGGNKRQSERDYRGHGSSPLSFTRYYNSLYARMASDVNAPASIAGVAWSADYFQKVAYSNFSGFSTAFVFRPDSQRLIFQEVSGAFVGPADALGMRLAAQRDGAGAIMGWVLRLPNDTVETYDAAGKLLSIAERGGITQTLSYDGAGKLATVTDSFGHQLQFSFTGNRLASITQPDGGLIQYTYHTNGTLTHVTDATGNTRQYHYASGSYLTGITDENAQRHSTYAYDPNTLHAKSTELAGGVQKYVIGYPSTTSRTVTDPAGSVRTVSLNLKWGVRRFASSTGSACAGCAISQSTTLDDNANVASRKDFNHRLTCYAYDTARNLETVRVEGFASSVPSCPSNLAAYTPASGTRERKIVTAWHATFRLPTSITEANRTTMFTHDANGNVLTRTVTDTSVTPNVSRTWTYTYDAFGRVLTENGPLTDVTDLTTFTYYNCTTGAQCGQVHTLTNAAGHVTTFNAYDAHGQVTQITDPNGLVTTLAYDARQRMTARCVGGTLPSCSGGELTQLEYWPTGLLKKVTSPDASFLQYTYDDAHRLTQIQDGAGNQVVYTLDNSGNRTAENIYDPSNALKRTHTRVYNALNQLWKDINAAGTAAVTTTFGYDAQGNQTTVAAPLSRHSTSTYDELNRLNQITDPAFGITQFAYDANDNLTAVTDPRALVTSYTYSGFGDLKTQVSPDTGTTTNTFDSAGNLATSTDARGAVTSYTYDHLNRVASAAYTLGGVTDQTIAYTYDGGTNQKGHLTGASDANHSLSWSYDPHGRVTGKGQTVGSITKSLGYGYNSSGQLASLVLPSGSTIQYGYNANNQVTSVTLAGSPSVTILHSATYDPFGPITGWSWGNGTLSTSRTFDADGKLTELTSAGQRTFGYDDAFRITAASDIADPSNSWTLGYDLLDRLSSATKTGTTIGYSYDANGNRLVQTGSSASTYTVSGTSNKLHSTAGALARSYTYDAAGNTLTSGATVHTYNPANRMKTGRLVGNADTSYVYNALGQRVKKSGGVITSPIYFVYDEAGHLVGEYDSTGALIQETVWLGDIPVATLRPKPDGAVDVFYVHTDQRDTPRKVSQPSDNQLRWKWDPTPFGEGLPNENPASLGAFKYNLRFPGQYFDVETNLSYNYFRDYDPAVGRYVQSDPLLLPNRFLTDDFAFFVPVLIETPSWLHPYAYVRSQPINDVDELGLGPWKALKCMRNGSKLKKYSDECRRRCPPDDLMAQIRFMEAFDSPSISGALLKCTCRLAELHEKFDCGKWLKDCQKAGSLNPRRPF